MRFFTVVLFLLTAPLVAHTAPLNATSLSLEKLRGQLAYIQKGDLWVINPDTLQKHRIFSGDVTAQIPHRAAGFVYSINEIESWAISPDLKSVAASVTASKNNQTPVESERKNPNLNGSQALYSFPLDGGKGRRLTADSVDTLFDVRWSPNSEQLSYTRHSFYDLDEGVVRGPNFHPSNDMGSLYEVCTIGSDGKSPRLVAGTRTSFAKSAFWSRDSKRLLFSTDLENSQLFTIAIDGSNPRPFDGNWSDFLRPDVAREVKIRAAFVGGSDGFAPRNTNQKIRTLQLVSIKPKQVLSIVWAEYEGFSLDGTVAVDARAEHVAFGGELNMNSVTLDSQGFLRLPSPQFLKGRGIYLQKFRAGQLATVDEPRLIVLEGQLIGWL